MQLFLRSYAPFKRFGGGYAGDHRGPSTDTRDTAKIRYVLTISFEKMEQVGSPNADCSKSHASGLFPTLLSVTAPLSAGIDHNGVVTGTGTAKHATTVLPIGRPGHGLAVTAKISAANPLVGPAADIDVQLNIRIEKNGPNLRIEGNLAGDAFPSAEVFLRDAAGDAILLHHYTTPGGEMGPYQYLPGHNFRPMGAFLKVIKMSNIGLIDTPQVPAR